MDLNKEYNKKKVEIKKRLKEFSKGDEFYELCFCLLTPQSNAKKCWEAVLELKKLNFKNKDIKIEEILRSKTRFYKNKSKYLYEMKNKKIKFDREYLVNNIKGMNYKEASHYLRNMGFRDNAILDRHILKNLIKFKVIDEIPKNLNKKKYLEIEEKFKNFSKKVKIPMDELDLLFWSMENGEIFK